MDALAALQVLQFNCCLKQQTNPNCPTLYRVRRTAGSMIILIGQAHQTVIVHSVMALSARPQVIFFLFSLFFFTRFLSPVDSPDCSYSSNYDVKTDTIYPESFYDHLDFFLHDTPSVQCAKG